MHTEEELQELRAESEEVWKAWLEHGLSQDADVTADFRAYCTSREQADRVAADLRDAGYDVRVKTTRTLLIFRGWVVKGSRTTTWTLDRLQSELMAFASVCGRHDALLDGYGALLPG